MNGKDLNKYAITPAWTFKTDSVISIEDEMSNDLQEIIAKAEEKATESNKDIYIAQLVRIVKVKRPAVELETVVVK